MSFVVRTTNYDLEKTLKSGQVFRFKLMSDNSYRVISRNRMCYVKQIESNIYVRTGEDAGIGPDDIYWRTYFNFAKSHDKLEELVSGNSFLQEVYDYNKGLRMLKQDPWEGLISFIISQQKRIPQIQASIEKLCDAAGSSMGYGIFAFPTPQEVLQVSIASVKLGYREQYILAAAEEVSSGRIDLARLHADVCSYKTCIQTLCSIRGVGIKVANCTALFSLGHTQAFPVDVHIERILSLPEMQNFRAKDYGDDAGLMQQYLFNYAINHGL